MAEKSEQKYFTSDEVLQNILADEVDLSDKMHRSSQLIRPKQLILLCESYGPCAIKRQILLLLRRSQLDHSLPSFINGKNIE